MSVRTQHARKCIEVIEVNERVQRIRVRNYVLKYKMLLISVDTRYPYS